MLFISLLLKVFLFIGLPTLGTLVNFDWFIHLVDCSNVSTTYLIFNLKVIFFCTIIGVVHQFIGQCLIPLDP